MGTALGVLVQQHVQIVQYVWAMCSHDDTHVSVVRSSDGCILHQIVDQAALRIGKQTQFGFFQMNVYILWQVGKFDDRLELCKQFIVIQIVEYRATESVLKRIIFRKMLYYHGKRSGCLYA